MISFQVYQALLEYKYISFIDMNVVLFLVLKFETIYLFSPSKKYVKVRYMKNVFFSSTLIYYLSFTNSI